MEKVVLCDTNILVDFYKGVERIIDELKLIQEQHIAISVITASELLFGALNKQELRQILRSIGQVHVLPLTKEIGELQLELLTEFALSHNLNLPDALIAATAIQYDIPLFTLNVKDFHYLPAIKLYTPSWGK